MQFFKINRICLSFSCGHLLTAFTLCLHAHNNTIIALTLIYNNNLIKPFTCMTKNNVKLIFLLSCKLAFNID